MRKSMNRLTMTSIMAVGLLVSSTGIASQTPQTNPATTSVASPAKSDVDRAIADYDEGIKNDPNKASLYIDRGLAYFDKEDYR